MHGPHSFVRVPWSSLFNDLPKTCGLAAVVALVLLLTTMKLQNTLLDRSKKPELTSARERKHSSIMTLWKQIRVLHYRNMCIRRHHWLAALFEIAIPTLIFGLVTKVAVQHNKIFHFESNETIYPVQPESDILTHGLTHFPFLDLTFAPNNSATKRIVDKMVEVIKDNHKHSVIEIKTHGVDSESAIVDRIFKVYGNKNDTPLFIPAFGIYFRNINADSNEIPKHIDVVIRPVNELVDTNVLVSTPGSEREGRSAAYIWGGSLAIDWALQDAVLKLSSNSGSTLPKVLIEEFPQPASSRDESVFDLIFKFLPAATLFSMTLIFPFLLKNIISEKETGAKELMKMMGLKSWMTWVGWLMAVLMTQLITLAIVTFFMTAPVFGPPLLKSSPTLLFVYLLLYVLVAICFSFALCPIFKRPTVGVCVAMILWYATGYKFEIPNDSRFKILRYASYLFPNIALNRGWASFHYFELRADGAHWSDFYTRPVDRDTSSLAVIFGSFTLQIVIFSIITWYLDAVRPGPYGIPESLLFFTKKSYWSNTGASKEFVDDESDPMQNRNFEPVSRDLKPGIQVRNLKKSFKNVTAVNKVSVNFYQGEITALLGHNGAGKTTTMSMLTGMIPADSGKVIVDDYNIFDNISQFRENLGLCPQHNLLFNYLNVLEHLIFFGLLKGLSKKQAYTEALNLMELQNISSKKSAMIGQLSGGMKRKLSLAIALIGSPKILMLDEPTSGMDPESRREMWNLLLNMRGERTIILTTHFMEEADVLGDRIAIMDHGEIMCFGTSIMLKKLYGAGYYLNVLKQKNFTQNRDLITSAIQEFIPEAELRSDEGPKLTYILPTESVDGFPSMFTKLESLKNELGIASLGVSCTTMEEVFLKVGEIAAEERDSGDNESSNSQENYSAFTSPEGDSGKLKLQPALLCQQFSALLNKKLIYSYRRRFMYLIFGIVPILASILSNFLLNSQEIGPPPMPALELDPSIYDTMQIYYHSNDSNPYAAQLKDLVPLQTPVQIPPDQDTNQYLLNLGKADLNEYYAENLLALQVSKTSVTAMYNQIAIHSLPISLNLAYNLLLKSVANRTLSTTLHPLSLKVVEPCALEPTSRGALFVFYAFAWIQFFGTSLLILTGSLIAFPIVERLNNAKQLQLMTGVSPVIYWMTTFIVDYAYFLIVSFLSVFVFVISGNLLAEAGVILCFILMISGVSNILFAYVLSYFKKSYASCYSLYLNINLFVGTYGAIIVYAMLKLNGASGEAVINRFWLGLADYILRFLPQYPFLIALMTFLWAAFENSWCVLCPNQPCTKLNYFEWSTKSDIGLNNYLLTLAIDALIYLAIIILVELGYIEQIQRLAFNRICGTHFLDENHSSEDPDVNEEKDRVDSAKDQPDNISDHLLIVDNLVKKFSRTHAAVRGISFAVKPGECFGLLGVNGAGKTTTFRMITGDTLPTIGDCSIFNYFLSQKRQKYLSMIGYCPQFDGINEYLTGNEMLETFAKLRGVHRSKINQQISKWLSTLGLNEYRHKLCGTYSGGNKRKLSTAMALIGDPSLVVLDEPTSGVDPISRRKLWNVLLESRKHGQAIVFTSHSMDECETLCDRLTIMVAGKMMCIGNVEYLKQRYAQGYSIMIKLGNATESDLQDLKDMVIEKFGNDIVLKDKHAGLLNYHITQPSVPLSELFSRMQSIRESMNIVEDYQICNTTLEQVFLAFARSEAKIIET
ncbi:phospholipid-transporting ATPase ABCA3 isoform X1 [Bemisia tabaci]|uniref:phospholipid-transporting ATPase ABCA3 isoform X1 n=2 Tax=Bemisia tabaci TaxID=7038 RepID=UPI003B285C54